MFNRIPLGKAVIILQQMFTAHSSQLTEMWGKQRSLLHGAWSSTDKPQHRDETNLWDEVGGRHDGTPKKSQRNPSQGICFPNIYYGFQSFKDKRIIPNLNSLIPHRQYLYLHAVVSASFCFQQKTLLHLNVVARSWVSRHDVDSREGMHVEDHN